MSSGKKPDTKIVLKPAQGDGPTITLAAFWTTGEKPSGGLDRRIKRLKLELEDGTIVQVSNEHGAKSHWCNLYLDRGDAPPQRRPNRGGDNWSDPTSGREPSFGGGDDDIPF